MVPQASFTHRFRFIVSNQIASTRPIGPGTLGLHSRQDKGKQGGHIPLQPHNWTLFLVRIHLCPSKTLPSTADLTTSVSSTRQSWRSRLSHVPVPLRLLPSLVTSRHRYSSLSVHQASPSLAAALSVQSQWRLRAQSPAAG